MGLVAFGMDTKLGNLSGGQRAKVMLARMFLEVPDVLILDEPTNFLDREHIEWLTKYLTIFKGSFIVVSHDYALFGSRNKVVNCISDIEFGVITRYNGNFDSFQRQKKAAGRSISRTTTPSRRKWKAGGYIQKTSRAHPPPPWRRRKKLEKMQVMGKASRSAIPTFVFDYTPPVGKKRSCGST